MSEEGRRKGYSVLSLAILAGIIFTGIVVEFVLSGQFGSARGAERKAWSESGLEKQSDVVPDKHGNLKPDEESSREDQKSTLEGLLRDEADTENQAAGPDSTTCRWSKYNTFESEIRNFVWGDNPEPRNFPRKILFVKTQKTGGSTVATILAKYAKHRNLTILPPPFPKPAFGNEDSIKQCMADYGIERIDGFVSHSTYYKHMFERYLETTSPFRLTIVREHFSRVWSAYFYAHGLYGSENLAFCSSVAKDPITWASNCNFVGKYQLDYVTPREWEPTDKTVDRIFNEFDHIFVTERMTESFLALMPKLNLTMDELLSVNLKSSQHHDVTPLQEKEFEEIVRSRSDPGMIAKENEFYLKANKKLDADLTKLPRFALDAVDDLKQMQVDLTDYCEGPGRRHFNVDCLYPGVGCHDECIRTWVAAQVHCDPEAILPDVDDEPKSKKRKT